MNRYSLAIIILSIAMASMSVWKGDWDGLIVPVIGIAVMCAPMIVTGDPNKGYDEHLTGIAIIPLVAFIVLFMANLFFDFEYYYQASIAVQACASMAFGIMIAVFLNARTEIWLPRRWIIVFALTFSTSISVLFTFSTIYWMYRTGYPLYNGDFTNRLEQHTVNMMLMLPMTVTTFATIVYGVVINWYMKRTSSLDLSRLWPLDHHAHNPEKGRPDKGQHDGSLPGYPREERDDGGSREQGLAHRRIGAKKFDLSDLICVSAAALLVLMTVLSAVGTDRTAYKLWTGVLCAIFCLIPMLFRHAGVMKLPLILVVMIEVTIFIHAYGVLLLLYDDITWYDTITHLAASITIGLLVFYALIAVEQFDHKTHFGPKGIPLFIALIMTTFSIYWEVLELVVDTTTGINMQYSPWDTIRDMVCNEAGTIIVTVSIGLYLMNHTDEEFIDGLKLHPYLKRAASRKSQKERSPTPVDERSGAPDSIEAPGPEGVAESISPAAGRMDFDSRK
jgi:hypothetical protein